LFSASRFYGGAEMSREDEARLAGRLITGDPSAFRELVEAFQRKVYGLAYEMTRNHADAEDVSQITFMKIHRAIGTFKPGCGLSTWIYQITHNAALDHIRRKPFYARASAPSVSAASGRPSDEPADSGPGPEAVVESASLRRRIDEALDTFSERERAVFVLRHYHELKVREIAQTLGISPGSVKSYLFRSLQKLQKELDDAGPRPGDGDRP
jgi:RNA polymerase sigma-70 factor, ECF subfamily